MEQVNKRKGENLVRLSTTRFGDIDIDESRTILIKAGILGFEHLKKYVFLLQDKEILFWWFSIC